MFLNHKSIKDGSIREVDYTADAKNGFNAIVKTHGPNSHPLPDDGDGENARYDSEHLQSKINHYSREQDTIILSSDLPQREPPIANLKDKRQPIPSLLELKPYTELKKPHELPDDGFRPSHGVRFTEVDPPDLSRYNSYNRQGGYSDIKKNDFTFHRNHNYNNNFNNYNPHANNNGYNNYNMNNNYNKPIYGTRHTEAGGAMKTRPLANKKPVQTQGLKQYSSYPYQKIANRNSYKRPDYNSYFAPVASATKSFANAIDEQAQASWRLIENIFKRNRMGYPAYAPTYASSNKDYFI